MKFNLGTLFGDSDFENILSRVDKVTSTLSSGTKLENPTKDNSSQALKLFVDTLQEGKGTDNNVLQQLLQNLTVSAQRSNRYNIYEEIYSSVQIIKSILRVYRNNILGTEIITGKNLIYIESNEFKTNPEQVKNHKRACQTFVKYFELEKYLYHKVTPELLKYGDHFIEIIDLAQDVTDLPSPSEMQMSQANKPSSSSVISNSETKMIAESFEFIEKRLHLNGDEVSKERAKSQALDEFVNVVLDFSTEIPTTDIDIFETISNLTTSEQELYLTENSALKIKSGNKKDINGFTESELKRFILRFHHPKNMVVLTTDYNNNVIGYVEVKESRKMEITPGVGMQFASMIKQISAISKDKTENQGAVVRKIVRKIIEKISAKVGAIKRFDVGKTKEEINRQYEQELSSKLGDDLFYIVKKLYLDSDPQSDQTLTKIKIRFIPADRMVHLCLNPNEYTPYGTSVIDSLIYPGKLYLLSQLTNMVTKLSRSALIRKWIIETGPREQHTNLMQQLKRELRNQRITVDDIVSFKSLPKILSDFKDMILLSKKGVKYVDVDVQSLGDPNIKISDLEDSRKELIALSGVPSPYLGYADAVDLREQLVHTNVTFATEIISIQNIMNSGLNQLQDKIFYLLGYSESPSKYIQPALKPPVILLLQMLEAVMSSVSNIQMSFQGTNVDFNPYYLLKKFVTNIDWDEFSQEAREYALFKKGVTPPNSGNDQSGGGMM